MKRMDDVDKLAIEQIIRLPFFHSLAKPVPDPKQYETTRFWTITFRCNRMLADGRYQLLDVISDDELIIRYKIIEF